jgi:hypothetical protein
MFKQWQHITVKSPLPYAFFPKFTKKKKKKCKRMAALLHAMREFMQSEGTSP